MYSIHIVQIGNLSIYASQLFNKYKNEFNLAYIDKEPLHDFIVSKAFSDYLNVYFKANMDIHNYYDLFDIIYKTEKPLIHIIISSIISNNKLNFLAGETCKLLVLGETCIIGRHNFEKFIN